MSKLGNEAVTLVPNGIIFFIDSFKTVYIEQYNINSTLYRYTVHKYL